MNPLVSKAIAMSLVLAIPLSMFVGMAFFDDDPGERVTGDAILPKFGSTAHLLDHLRSGSNSDSLYCQGGSSESIEDGAGHSDTNIQVEGVDEMDRVKTDGEFIYIVNPTGINIVQAYPAENMTNVSLISSDSLLSSGNDNQFLMPQGIFLFEDILAVVSMVHSYLYDPNPGNDSCVCVTPNVMSVVSVLDIEDRSDPQFIRNWGISGYPVAARMIDSRVYLISQDWIWSIDEEAVLSKVMNGSEIMTIKGDEVRYDPNASESNCYINLLSVDVGNGDFETFSMLAGYSSTIYMSEGSLYIAMTHWVWGMGFLEDVAGSDPEVTTTIFRMEIDGLHIDPMARGEVEGWPLNQFCMDENEEHLRVVTNTGWDELENCVTVLDAGLNITGCLTGLAPDETMYAARFYEDLLYLVTFEIIDPLFIIDLSDPESPRVLGDLEVPGFSTYLHRLDDARVLGIGMENGSIKVAIYDISDPCNPGEIDRHLVEGGYSTSEALWDHHAVLVDVGRGMLVIPVRHLNVSSGMWVQVMTVFDLSIEGIHLRGEIGMGEWGYGLRSIYIDDVLYSISDEMLIASSLSDLSEVNVLLFGSQSGSWDEAHFGASGVREW